MKKDTIPSNHTRFSFFQNKLSLCEDDTDLNEEFVDSLKERCNKVIQFCKISTNVCVDYLSSLTDTMLGIDSNDDIAIINDILSSEGIIPVIQMLFLSVYDFDFFEIIAKFSLQWTRGTELQIKELFSNDMFNKILKMINIEFEKLIESKEETLVLAPPLMSLCCNILIECGELPYDLTHKIFDLYINWVPAFPFEKSIFLHIVQIFSTIIQYSEQSITEGEAQFLANLFSKWIVDDEEILTFALIGYFHFFNSEKFQKYQQEYFKKDLLEILPILFVSDSPNTRKIALGILSLYVKFSTEMVFHFFNFSKMEYAIKDQSDDVKLCFISTIDFIVDFDDVIIYLSDSGILNALFDLSSICESFKVRNSSVSLILQKIISMSNFTILSNLIFNDLINVLIPFLFIFQGESLNLLLRKLHFIFCFINDNFDSKQFNYIISRTQKEKIPNHLEELFQDASLTSETADLIVLNGNTYRNMLSRFEESLSNR